MLAASLRVPDHVPHFAADVPNDPPVPIDASMGMGPPASSAAERAESLKALRGRASLGWPWGCIGILAYAKLMPLSGMLYSHICPQQFKSSRHWEVGDLSTLECWGGLGSDKSMDKTVNDLMIQLSDCPQNWWEAPRQAVFFKKDWDYQGKKDIPAPSWTTLISINHYIYILYHYWCIFNPFKGVATTRMTVINTHGEFFQR